MLNSSRNWLRRRRGLFAGPKAMLAYLSRYTHRVAISNRRLIALNQRSVTFKVKDYRIDGPGRYTTMTLDVGEFIRRFLSHVLPKGFHRIRKLSLFFNNFAGSSAGKSHSFPQMSSPGGERGTRPIGLTIRDKLRPRPCASPYRRCGITSRRARVAGVGGSGDQWVLCRPAQMRKAGKKT